MLENAVARRYSNAFFAIAQEQGLTDRLETELKNVVDAIYSNEDLKRVMEHQLVSPEEKKVILEKVFIDEISEVTMNFLKVVIEKYRASYIPAIYEEFVSYANEARNMADAQLKSAAELTEADMALIKTKLSEVTGKTVRLHAEVDPNLICGVVVRIGDKVIDSSLVGRLKKLKENLLQIEVKEIGVRN
ncbi:F0F1 ATP synthase subunit delta [Phosphitispora sp. TUW77]|uniref:F0F1 ATP synthase subunit delta n=1 Tax=Phosphitispora sp. TUW77 TaxID=3152361 RepID=UPI003AB78935